VSPRSIKPRDGEHVRASDETFLVAAVDRLLLFVGTALAAAVIYIALSK
jgi:hypothetical protein